MRALATFLLVLAFGTVITERALAQTSAPSITTETSLLPSMTAPKLGPVTFKGGIKSTNATGRFVEYTDASGRTYRLRNEYYTGVTHSSGWGLTLQAETSGRTFENSRNNAFGAGDPSLTIEHPALIDDGTNKVWGQLRRYFAVTDNSKASNLAQYAYYLYATRQLAGRAEIFNLVIIRDFLRSLYRPSDTVYVLDDTTKFTQRMNSWLKLGVAHHMQFEWHDQSPVGQYFEVYPYADFVLSKNVYIEPRLVMPLHKVNEVHESARTVGLNGAQAELYLQVSL